MKSKYCLFIASSIMLFSFTTAAADIMPGAPEGSCCIVEGIEGRSHQVTGDDGSTRWSCGAGIAWSREERRDLEIRARQSIDTGVTRAKPSASKAVSGVTRAKPSASKAMSKERD